MKTIGCKWSRAVILVASLLVLRADHAAAQTADATASVGPAQAHRVPARITQTVDDSNRFTLRGNVHPMARSAFDRGAVADSQPATRMSLLLKRSDEQEIALRQLLDQQQDRSSPNYHKWLTPDQFGKQFGPADTDIAAVTDWLTSRGFTGIKVNTGRTLIEFSGNVGQVRNAFQTEIHHFLVNGKMHVANVSDPQIPAALAPVVGGVVSLHDFRPTSQARKLGSFRRNKDTGEVKPLFTFAGCGTGAATQPCYAVGPGDFAKIYNVPTAQTGAGVTIAIVQDSNINITDVQKFRALFGLPANFTSSNIILNGPDPGIQGPDSVTGDEIEADLDVEWAGAVAPQAKIDLVVSEDSETLGTFGTDLSAIYIIDNNIAPILSESFGACEAGITTDGEQFYNALWQQASAQGITVILSAGDSGSATCDPAASAANQDVAANGIAVSGLASTIYNVALGGTDFQNGNPPSAFWNTANAATTQTSAKSYVPESTWNDSCAATATVGSLGPCTATIVNANNNPNSLNFGIDLVAGGGGPSKFNTKPIWQSGVTGMPTANFRQVPDISLFSGNGANGSFYIICEQDANSGAGSSTSSCDLNSPFNDFQGVGGTSAAAPAFAGIMALVNQKTNERQGNANFVLYNLYKKNTAGTICPSNTASVTATGCIFYDTIKGNNSVACKGGSTNCSNTSVATNQFGVLVDPTKTNTPAFQTTTGYDNATGLGSVNVTNLVNAWASGTAPTVTLNLTPTSIGHGDTATATVTVTGAGGTPTGTVSLIAQPPGFSQVGVGTFSQNITDGSSTLSGGSATITTNLLPGGSGYPVIASYSGDGIFASANSAPVTVTVSKENSETSVGVVTFDAAGNSTVHTTPTSLPYGSPYILQISVSDSSGNQCHATVVTCPTGTVTLTNNGAALNDFSGKNTAPLNSFGIAEDQPVQLAAGAHSLVATYIGDNSYSTSTSPASSLTVTAAATTTNIAASPAVGVTTTTAVTLTARVATQSTGAGPMGTVTFMANGTAIGSAVAVIPVAAAGLNSASPANAFATATLSHTFATAGTVSVTAKYITADGNYSSSTSAATSLSVGSSGTVATTTVLKPSATSINSGDSVTFTATVTGSNNVIPGISGTVQFLNGTTPLGAAATCSPTAGTATTPALCVATLTTTLANLVPGPATPSNRVPDLPIRPITIVVALSALLLIAGQKRFTTGRRLGYSLAAVLLFACVTAGISGCGGSSGGSTTPPVTPPTPTTHIDSITAVYSGDTTYVGSTSAAVSITVTVN